eukprot:1160018-Pelagomonas_calceolata.AAC.8
MSRHPLRPETRCGMASETHLPVMSSLFIDQAMQPTSSQYQLTTHTIIGCGNVACKLATRANSQAPPGACIASWALSAESVRLSMTYPDAMLSPSEPKTSVFIPPQELKRGRRQQEEKHSAG